MRRRTSGFTLVEVVISLAILAIAFFGLISVITYTTRMNMSTKERMLAMRAAEKKIEQMLSAGDFDSIYTTFGGAVGSQTEGLGWEQVEGLEPVVPAPVAPPTDAPIGYNYPTSGARPVLFVRFPLNSTGNGFNEAGTGAFTDTYTLANANQPASASNPKTFVDLDLNRNGVNTDAGIVITNCRILPVSVEVYWRGIVGPSRGNTGNNYLIYRYTFLRKT
jgi:prepilin-type N-terminal cleavage/methylation domain-containing protein